MDRRTDGRARPVMRRGSSLAAAAAVVSTKQADNGRCSLWTVRPSRPELGSPIYPTQQRQSTELPLHSSSLLLSSIIVCPMLCTCIGQNKLKRKRPSVRPASVDKNVT